MAPNKEMFAMIKRDMQAQMPSIASALPQTAQRYLTPERLTKVALLAIGKNPSLLNCSRASILQAVMDTAQMGLELGGALGHAYLVPFKQQATAIIGYRGYIALARRSGEIQSVNAQVVYERDEFDLDLASGEIKIHRPYMDGDRGKETSVYCVAHYRDGGGHTEWMPISEIEKIRKRSPSVKRGQSSPWDTDYAEMARKTVVRRAAKYWPLSTELADAINYDLHQEGYESSPSVTLEEESEPESRTEQVLEVLKSEPVEEKPAPEPEEKEEQDEHPFIKQAEDMTVEAIAEHAVTMDVPVDFVKALVQEAGITEDKRTHSAARKRALAGAVIDAIMGSESD
jgi:recombination protein RecT